MTKDRDNSAFLQEVRSRIPGTRTALSFILGILTRQRGLLVISTVLLLVSSSAMVVGPRVLGLLVDQVSNGGERRQFYFLVLFYVVSELVRLIASAAHSFSIARLGQASLHDLRQRVFRKIEHLPLRLHDRARTGELMTFITNDVQALSDMFSAGFMAVIEKLLVVIFTVCSLFLLSPKLAGIGLGLFFLLFVLGIFFSRLLKAIYREVRQANSLFNSALSENVEGIAVSRLNGFEAHRLQEFSRVTERLRRAQLAPIKVFGAFHPSVTIVNALSVAALGIFGGDMVIRGEISLGTLVAALGYILWLFWPIIIIVDRWNTFLNGISATERLVGLLGLDQEDLTHGALIEDTRNRGEIVFEHVWFAYQDENWVIRDLSMTIKPGSRVAFFGPTGSGKTTLTSLLLRFYEPQKGRILIDGIDIRSLSLDSLRGLFGVVQQDAILYQGTIAENVMLFDDATPDGTILLSEGAFNLNDKVATTLSMGEKQLIAFDRARYRNPKLWILDEATAHLDPALDHQLEQALLKESLGRTVIIIAHRISSLAVVDTIFVLSKGALLEQGSHQSLVDAGGFYAQYILLQQELDRESFAV